VKHFLLATTLAFCSCFALAQSAQVVELASRPGVKQVVLVETPAGPPTGATLVLLMGGNGQLGIYPNGSLRRDSHFLARVRGLLTARGHVTVLVDTPSDRRDLDGDFRDGKEHAADLASIISYARTTFGKPVWLVGHSRGTHSAVTAATRLHGDNAPDGIVLAAPMLDSNRFASSTAKPLQESGVETLRIAVLVLQHTKDACPVSTPAKLPELQAKLPPTTSKLITYEGGISKGALCDVQAFHSFNGIEAQVVEDLSAYVSHWK
jgi:alpha-beta hydrolase superfamily lysophospholipase